MSCRTTAFFADDPGTHIGLPLRPVQCSVLLVSERPALSNLVGGAAATGSDAEAGKVRDVNAQQQQQQQLPSTIPNGAPHSMHPLHPL